jgi:hypothetical protein
MADPSRYRSPASEPATRGLPGWVTVAGIVVAIVLLLALSLMLFGGLGGGHGPRPHGPAGGAAGQTPPAGVTPAAPVNAPSAGAHARP